MPRSRSDSVARRQRSRSISPTRRGRKRVQSRYDTSASAAGAAPTDSRATERAAHTDSGEACHAGGIDATEVKSDVFCIRREPRTFDRSLALVPIACSRRQLEAARGRFAMSASRRARQVRHPGCRDSRRDINSGPGLVVRCRTERGWSAPPVAVAPRSWPLRSNCSRRADGWGTAACGRGQRRGVAVADVCFADHVRGALGAPEFARARSLRR